MDKRSNAETATRLRDLRLSKNLTMREVAEQLGVSASTVCLRETGKRGVPEGYVASVEALVPGQEAGRNLKGRDLIGGMILQLREEVEDATRKEAAAASRRMRAAAALAALKGAE